MARLVLPDRSAAAVWGFVRALVGFRCCVLVTVDGWSGSVVGPRVWEEYTVVVQMRQVGVGNWDWRSHWRC